ncbi:type II secretion system GspH family protein [Patescibacteria group bacterium]|nr:type II secretion system GspH family protein [Patescibacteria group bacterium]
MKKGFLSKTFFFKGFTLIELLIVIAILGILAGAILIAINPGQKIASARNARVKSDLAIMFESAKEFNLQIDESHCRDGGSYPSNFGEDGGISCGIVWYSPTPAPPSGYYDYQSIPAGTCLPTKQYDDSLGTGPCTSFSISGPAYLDPNSVPPVTTTTSRWCIRSSSGTITLDSICNP